jgi:alkanesulfonate monooxygenase SsuD/methylene tetrahydromethanopterin reductase-like flavin-dependent oxidoreductase (luciferase family)
MLTYLLARTSRVRVGAAVVNITLTHPLRLAERVALLDHLGSGRIDICIGRGYQWPQNVVFGVEEASTKARFEESFDILLAAWDGQRHAHHGHYYDFPEVRVWPDPVRSADEVFLYATGSSTSLTATLGRRIPAAYAAPFSPLASTADAFVDYIRALESSDLDAEKILDRTVVVLYALLAPTKKEAREIARRPFEWHISRLARLQLPPGVEPPPWESLYAPDDEFTPLDDDNYDERCDSMLLFDDPQSCREKIAMLRDAGVRNVVPWMGCGGVAQEHVMRSISLFAEEVMPHFAD